MTQTKFNTTIAIKKTIMQVIVLNLQKTSFGLGNLRASDKN